MKHGAMAGAALAALTLMAHGPQVEAQLQSSAPTTRVADRSRRVTLVSKGKYCNRSKRYSGSGKREAERAKRRSAHMSPAD